MLPPPLRGTPLINAGGKYTAKLQFNFLPKTS